MKVVRRASDVLRIGSSVLVVVIAGAALASVGSVVNLPNEDVDAQDVLEIKVEMTKRSFAASDTVKALVTLSNRSPHALRFNPSLGLRVVRIDATAAATAPPTRGEIPSQVFNCWFGPPRARDFFGYGYWIALQPGESIKDTFTIYGVPRQSCTIVAVPEMEIRPETESIEEALAMPRVVVEADTVVFERH